MISMSCDWSCRLYQVLEKSCTGTFEELESEMKSTSDGSCPCSTVTFSSFWDFARVSVEKHRKMAPHFFEGLQTAIPLHVFGGLSTAFKMADFCTFS